MMETFENSASEEVREAGREPRPAEVKVWDIFIRFFHWSLVSAFAIAWLTADEWDKVHDYAGYFIGGLLVFRILWGLVGTKYARFTQFIYPPAIVIGHLKDTLHFRSRRYLGHNPAGGAMIIALLLSLIVITVTGIMMTTDAYWGIAWVEELHEAVSTFTLLLVVLHIAGVILTSFEHKENLVKSMWTGRKRP